MTFAIYKKKSSHFIVYLIAYHYYYYYYLWFVPNGGVHCETIVELPKVNIHDITIDEFQSVYLDKFPIILTGVTTCPSKLDFTNIHHHCKGGGSSIPGNYVNTKKSNSTSWAGLEEGDSQNRIDFHQWVDNMGNNNNANDEPQFLFDIPMAEICPTLLEKITIPSHFVGIFSSQFQYFQSKKENQKQQQQKQQQQQEEDTTMDDICPQLPFYNMYLAEEKFETELHIDSTHSSFIASMCVGRKIWRIMTNQDYIQVHSQIGEGGRKILYDNDDDPVWVMGSIKRPFHAWGNAGTQQESSLTNLDVTIYQGILEPNEILYIPAGAPHAATTLDHSLMVASNDHTIRNLKHGIQFCNLLQNDHITCSGFQSKMKNVIKNYDNYYRDIFQTNKLTKISLPKSTSCEKSYSLLSEVDWRNNPQITQITPQNFRSLVEQKPIIIFKTQNNCGYCLYALKNWNKIATSSHNTNIQYGIIHCFQGTCQPGIDPLYKSLIMSLSEKTSPAFLFVTLKKNKNELKIAHYNGFYSFDDVNVWASIHTNSSIKLDPYWWKLLLIIFHHFDYLFRNILLSIGPIGIGLFIGLTGLCLIFVWELIVNKLLRKTSFSKNKRE